MNYARQTVNDGDGDPCPLDNIQKRLTLGLTQLQSFNRIRSLKCVGATDQSERFW